MLLGLAQDNAQASLMVTGRREATAPQLYAAPDPGEDPEAQKAMEHLATLALQIQQVRGSSFSTASCLRRGWTS